MSVKKSVLKFFGKKKYVFHYGDLQIYLRLGLKLKKHKKEQKQKTMVTKNGKNKDVYGKDVYGKTITKLRNKIDVRRVSKKKTKKMDISYVSKKIFDIDLVAICKSKVIFKLNKLA